jgi:hypothetical protein
VNQKSTTLLLSLFLFGGVTKSVAQNAPNVSQVALWSTIGNTNIGSQFSQNSGFTPNTSGTLPRALLSLYTLKVPLSGDTLNVVNNYNVVAPLNSAISTAIGVALSIVPVASPASAVIQKTDPVTGATLPANGSLGPIFTERAETIGKGKFYIGFSHQDFHFTEFNGRSLNGLTMLYPGAKATGAGINQGGIAPATFNFGMDIRLSQNMAFITAGLTNNLELSLGLPVVHSSVAARTYNGEIYSGDGLGGGGVAGVNCWCINTFSPGTFQLTQGQIGSASGSKTGFGDLLVRVKDSVLNRPNSVLTVGADVRFPTGDADNYLGTGTTSFKPFMAMSFYSKPSARGFVFSPHFDVGWLFSGKSVLAGDLQGSQQSATMQNGDKITYLGAPLVSTKDYLPDVFTWAVGSEWALGKRNTVVTDILGNQIGWIHGAPTLTETSAQGYSPIAPYPQVTAQGLTAAGRGSFGQYNLSLGYKALITGNLVATFNVLLRLNDAGLTARVTPLYGLSYTF